jgi:DNA repair exonuclease SbcCD ATPase subunit
MQIDSKFLTEENYSNPRFVPVTSEKVKYFYEEIQNLQKEANPKIQRFNEIETKMIELRKPFDDYKNEVEAETKQLKDELDALNQKSSALQEKMLPLVLEDIAGKLNEFDDIVGVDRQDDVISYKIHDKLEDTVKALRNSKKSMV